MMEERTPSITFSYGFTIAYIIDMDYIFWIMDMDIDMDMDK